MTVVKHSFISYKQLTAKHFFNKKEMEKELKWQKITRFPESFRTWAGQSTGLTNQSGNNASLSQLRITIDKNNTIFIFILLLVSTELQMKLVV